MNEQILRTWIVWKDSPKKILYLPYPENMKRSYDPIKTYAYIEHEFTSILSKLINFLPIKNIFISLNKYKQQQEKLYIHNLYIIIQAKC